MIDTPIKAYPEKSDYANFGEFNSTAATKSYICGEYVYIIYEQILFLYTYVKFGTPLKFYSED